jgi:hypothetical protein
LAPQSVALRNDVHEDIARFGLHLLLFDVATLPLSELCRRGLEDISLLRTATVERERLADAFDSV